MKLQISLSANDLLDAQQLKHRIGARAFNSITTHPWYLKYLRPVYPQQVRFKVVDDGGFFRVAATYDGERMYQFSISRALNKLSKAPSMFEWEDGARNPDGSKRWIYKWSYDDVKDMK
jgi:hypothetical protein